MYIGGARPVELVATISPPYENPPDYTCELRLLGGAIDLTERVHGVDEVQAVVLALELLHVHLCRISRGRTKVLLDGAEDLGLMTRDLRVTSEA
jgi:hypothetical protein